jgi:hypothetical protein
MSMIDRSVVHFAFTVSFILKTVSFVYTPASAVGRGLQQAACRRHASEQGSEPEAQLPDREHGDSDQMGRWRDGRALGEKRLDIFEPEERG